MLALDENAHSADVAQLVKQARADGNNWHTCSLDLHVHGPTSVPSVLLFTGRFGYREFCLSG
jgi:hypothetical protein